MVTHINTKCYHELRPHISSFCLDSIHPSGFENNSVTSLTLIVQKTVTAVSCEVDLLLT